MLGSAAQARGGPAAKDSGQAFWIGKSFWVERGVSLYVSGLLWDVKGLADHLGVSVDAICWAVVLSRKGDAKRLKECDKLGTAGHETLKAAAHNILNFDRADCRQFSRILDPERDDVSAALTL